MFGNMIEKHKKLNAYELTLLYFLVICLAGFIVQNFFRTSEIHAVKQQIRNSEIIQSLAGGKISKVYFDYLLGFTESKQQNVITLHVVGNKHKFPLTVYYAKNSNKISVLHCDLFKTTISLSQSTFDSVSNKLDGSIYCRMILAWLAYSLIPALLLLVMTTQEKWGKYIKEYRCFKVYFYLKQKLDAVKLTGNLGFFVYSIFIIYCVSIAVTMAFYWLVL